MPATVWGWQITPVELRSWLVEECDGVLVVNKPAGVVCHPSKHGPWSSLAGACREYLGATTIHMPFRLDRETSGVMLVTAVDSIARRLQQAVQRGAYWKSYLALLSGALYGETTVALRLGPAPHSLVRLRQAPRQDGAGRVAATRFLPLITTAKATLARVLPAPGRLHQIRAHARALGRPLYGDKIYGPDERLFMEFIAQGWTPRHQHELEIRWQALHCESILFPANSKQGERRFHAPFAPVMKSFCERVLGQPVDTANDYLPLA
jgi:23S rRNA pseudouridine1911/1915/1917 synthase